MKKEKIAIMFLLLVFPLLTGCGGVTMGNSGVENYSILSMSRPIYPVEEIVYEDAGKILTMISKENREIKNLVLNYKLENYGENTMVDSGIYGMNLSFDKVEWIKGGIDISKLCVSKIISKFEKLAVIHHLFEDRGCSKKLVFLAEPLKKIDNSTILNGKNCKGKDMKNDIYTLIDAITDNYHISTKDMENLRKIELSDKKSYLMVLEMVNGGIVFSVDGKKMARFEALDGSELELINELKKFKYSLPIVVDKVELYSDEKR
jgi:hypothetical protein